MDHGEGKSGSDGGIDGVAARLHDLDAGLRCQFVHADHHGMLRVDRTGGGHRDRRAKTAKAITEQDQISVLCGDRMPD